MFFEEDTKHSKQMTEQQSASREKRLLSVICTDRNRCIRIISASKRQRRRSDVTRKHSVRHVKFTAEEMAYDRSLRGNRRLASIGRGMLL